MHRILPVFFVFLILPFPAARAQESEGAAPAPAPEFTILKELPRRDAIDQGMTGTCWAFATTSFLETEAERITGKPVDLSEVFTVRQAILEKVRRQLASEDRPNFGEGGLSHDVIWSAREHGLVPAAAYLGRPENQRSHNHSELFRLLDAMIKEVTAKKARPSPHLQRALAAFVDAYLGVPPAEVQVEGRTLSPKEYATSELKLPLDDYVELMSYSYAPFHAKATLTVPDNWMRYSDYLNVPLDEFMTGIDHALDNGYSVAVDIDVSEKGFQGGAGRAILVPEEMEKPGAVTQDVRDKMFADKTTTDDHLMHIVGLARHRDGRRFYLTKDSGGPKRGPYQGHTFISENYLRAKALGYMVHKDALPKAR